MHENTKPNFLSIEDVCRVVPGLTPEKLAQLRYKGEGPKYFKPTHKTVLYSEEEIYRWVLSTERQGTDEG